MKDMDFVNPVSFPFAKWFVASTSRVKWLAAILVAGAVISFGDVWLERRAGTATVRLLRTQASAVRTVKPGEFDRIIRFEMVRSLGMLLLAVVIQGIAGAASRRDIFSPGAGLNDDAGGDGERAVLDRPNEQGNDAGRADGARL